MEGLNILVKHLIDSYPTATTTELLYSYLPFLYSYVKTGKFNNIVRDDIVNKCKEHVEANHQKINFAQLMNVISILGNLQSRSNFSQYVENRVDEIGKLSFNFLSKILKRGLNTENHGLRKFYVNSLIPEYVLVAENEKISGQAKALSVCLKTIDNPKMKEDNSRLSKELSNFLNNILTKIEEFDSVTILSMTELMQHYHENDSKKFAFLREINEMIVSTLKSSPENVKFIFLIKFVENLYQFKKVLNKESLSLYFDYFSNNEALKKLSQNQVLMLFDIMRSERFYDNKDVITKLCEQNLLVNNFRHLGVNRDHLESTKAVIKEVLGEEYYNKFAEKLCGDGYNFFKSSQSIKTLLEVCTFMNMIGPKTKSSEDLKALLIDLAKKETSLKQIKVIVEDFIVKQKLIGNATKDVFLENLINQIKLEDIEAERSDMRFLISICELHIPKSNEVLRKKVTDITNKLFEKENNIVNLVQNLSRYVFDNRFLTNSSVIRMLIYLREEINKPEFTDLSDSRFTRSLFLISNNLLKRNDSDVSRETVASLIAVTEQAVEKNPKLYFELNYSSAIEILKNFKSHNIKSNLLLKSIHNFLLETYTVNKDKSPSQDVYLALGEIINSNAFTNQQKKDIYNKIIINDENALNLYKKAKHHSIRVEYLRFLTSTNRRHSDLVSNDLLAQIKDDIIIQFNESGQQATKGSHLASLTFFRDNIVQFQENFKQYSGMIKDFFSKNTFFQNFKFIEGLPQSTRNSSLSKRLHSEFAYLYEKENNISTLLFKNIIKHYTNSYHKSTSFFNKIISDYENHFDKLYFSDHIVIVETFSKVHLNHEELVKSAVKKIVGKRSLSNKEELSLFNSLVNLGYTNQEWKDLILTRIVSQNNFGSFISSNNTAIELKMETLLNLYSLKWPENYNQIIDDIVESLNKSNFKTNSYFSRMNNMESRLELSAIKNSSLFSKFRPELQTTIKETLATEESKNKNSNLFKLIEEFLQQMLVPSDLEVNPNDIPCDFYDKSSKTGILVLYKSQLNFSENEPNFYGNLRIAELKPKVDKVVLLNVSEILPFLNENDPSLFIAKLEEYGIPNANKEKKYNFEQILKLREANQKYRNQEKH